VFDVQAFVAVVQTGSFTAAARHLDVPKSTVSRRVAALEERLGVQLLVRTTRSVRATDLGLAYFERADAAVSDLAEAEAAITELADAPRGSLLVTAPTTLGHLFLSPVVVRYATTYPDVRVHVHLADRMVNLVEEGFDVALRGGPLPPSTLTGRRIAATTPVLCASPQYLARRGPVTDAGELEGHDCLVNDAVPWGSRWPLGPRRTVRVRPRFTSNSWEVVRDAALAGLGIALVPDLHVREDLDAGRLVEILPGQVSHPGGLWVVYPPSRYLLPKVRTFVDFVTQAFAESPLGAPPLVLAAAALLAAGSLGGCPGPAEDPTIGPKVLHDWVASMSGSSASFWDAPLPSEHRRSAETGRPSLTGFPNPDAVGFVDDLLVLVDDALPGFGTTSPIFFRLEVPPARSSLPDLRGSLEHGAAVFLAEVGTGERVPVTVLYEADAGPFGAPRLLSLLPLQGIPLKPATLYAAVVTRELRARSGERFGHAPALDDLADLPEGAEAAYTEALDALAGGGLAAEEIAGLAVFRTQDPEAELRTVAADLRARPRPEIDAPFALLETHADDARLVDYDPLGDLMDLVGAGAVTLPREGTAGERTAVVVQHAEDGVEDGHEVMFQLAAPKRQIACFLADFVAGVAAGVPDGAPGSPCP